VVCGSHPASFKRPIWLSLATNFNLLIPKDPNLDPK